MTKPHRLLAAASCAWLLAACTVSEKSADDDRGGEGGSGGSAGSSQPAGEGGTSQGGSAGTNGGTAGADEPGGAGGEAASGAGGDSGEASGGTSGTAGDAGAGGAPDATCMGIPERGECVSSNEFRLCVVPTGNGEPFVATGTCAAQEQCTVDDLGARCVPRPGRCSGPALECVNASTLSACIGGMPLDVTCDNGCRETALGAFCTDGAPTSSYTGTILYEVRGPNATPPTDWSSTTVQAPAQSLLVASFHNGELVDADVTGSDGSYSLDVPSPFATGDQLVAMLVHPHPSGSGWAFAVAQPDAADGEQELAAAPGTDPSVWSWSIDPTSTPSGTTVLITETLGSGAVRVYDYLRYAYAVAEVEYGAAGRTVVVWLRMNTSWTCGACFLAYPTAVGSLPFDSQVFIPATAQDRSFWSDPVTAHELGHWAMWSFGVSPKEGGRHCISVPTMPGQAWSEGWATGFSSMVRDSSLFYDKQRGSMFWFDLDQRSYATLGWTRPSPSAGVLQAIDENEVAAMIWDLTTVAGVEESTVYAALSSERMITAPFGRGYTRHVWDVDSSCARTDVFNTGESAPMFADFLDALRCSGVSASTVNIVTEPTTAYPYPSTSPICP